MHMTMQIKRQSHPLIVQNADDLSTHAADFTQNARTPKAQRNAIFNTASSSSPFCFATAGRLPLTTTQALAMFSLPSFPQARELNAWGPLHTRYFNPPFHDQPMLSTAANPLLWNSAKLVL